MIEDIVIHAKSYLVRWVEVGQNQSISWSLQPHRKSVQFGIFKHPGTKAGLSLTLPTQETVETSSNSNAPPTPALDGAGKSASAPRRASATENAVMEKLQAKGLKSVAWTGRCEPGRVTMGRYDVPEGEGGTYGLVFDNTFSKQTSKNVTFVLMTHPTDAPPKSGHHLHYALGAAPSYPPTGRTRKGSSPSLKPATESNESLPQGLHRAVLEDPRPASKGGRGVESKGIEGTSFYTGVLYKKRRKRGQGYAKRFFSLDFTSSTLSYYRNRHDSALRGAVPLSLAAVGANEKSREFSVDSGAEVWHLKSINKKDFEGWKNALERASGTSNAPTPTAPTRRLQNFPQSRAFNPQEDHEWEVVESLVSKVSGTRDAVRVLAKDTDPKYFSGSAGAGLALTTSASSSNNASPTTFEPGSQYFPDVEERAPAHSRRPFWKRNASTERSPSVLFRRSVSAQLAVPSPSLAGGPASPSMGHNHFSTRPSFGAQSLMPDHDVHERCMALLRDLDSVVADFSALVAKSKARRQPTLLTTTSRLSIDSIDSQEFFDANDGDIPSQLLSIRRSADFDGHDDHFDDISEANSDTSSEAGDVEIGSAMLSSMRKTSQTPMFPNKPRKLSPLPLSPVQRRQTVTPPKQAPPSVIGFLRKNAGKDLSTITMPVTANEPTSLLQRLAETFEYPQLLDAAAGASTPGERLMNVAAFAISYYANNRVKERAIRKPFNPMLGETFELVREDLGFRFIAEKVSHHPVRMACQAESLTNGGWSYAQSPQPVQKFWGKSVELNNEGRARVVIHASNEHYSWSQATCFLRNVIAGEKYVEPVQTMTVQNETNGMRAVATFKAGGMFSGRSEEVTVQLFDDGDVQLPFGLAGKWTEGLTRTDTGASIWTVGPVVPDAPKVYGFTPFAAALNQITEIEQGHLPPTDSRLRPDQQALEVGDVDKAEALKAHLEERQRARRKVLESHGQQWKPQFFEKVAAGAIDSKTDPDEEVWVLKEEDGYWDKRSIGDWSAVQHVFEV